MTLQCAGGWDIVQPNETASAAAFDEAVSELTGEELREGSEESSGHSDTAREPAREAVQLGPQSTLPGLENAVAENKKMAAVELGKKLTDKINEPAKSIESAAGLSGCGWYIRSSTRAKRNQPAAA